MLEAAADGQNKLVNGTISIAFLKDPTDPQWKNDPAMKLYRKIMARYAPERMPTIRSTCTGWRSPGRRSTRCGRPART